MLALHSAFVTLLLLLALSKSAADVILTVFYCASGKSGALIQLLRAGQPLPSRALPQNTWIAVVRRAPRPGPAAGAAQVAAGWQGERERGNFQGHVFGHGPSSGGGSSSLTLHPSPEPRQQQKPPAAGRRRFVTRRGCGQRSILCPADDFAVSRACGNAHQRARCHAPPVQRSKGGGRSPGGSRHSPPARGVRGTKAIAV